MDLLNVSASFLIGIGHGEGPEVRLLVSVTNPDGSPTALALPDPDDNGEWPIKVFVGLSARFAAASFPCKITAVETIYPPEPGFFAMTIALVFPDIGELHEMGPSVLSVIVDNGAARGQALASSAGVARIADVG
jgi:hypothetical protein